MQTFQIKPTDADLAGLLDPEGKSIGLRVEDTPERLIVHPRGIPLIFAEFFMALPLGVMYWLKPTVMPFGFAAAALAFGIFWLINWHIVSQGDFFILDRANQTIVLPRLSLNLDADQVAEFIEVHAWHTTRNGWSRESEWLRELSVLVRSNNGGFVCYPVITSSGSDVSHWSKYLAEFFGVERRVLKLTWSERRRLKQSRDTG